MEPLPPTRPEKTVQNLYFFGVTFDFGAGFAPLAKPSRTIYDRS